MLANSTRPSQQFTVANLSSGYEYRFRIVAVNVIGDSELSLSAGFIASTMPGVPAMPVFFSSTDLPSITIVWTVPIFNGGSTIQKYNIYVDNQLSGSVPGTVLTYTETTLLTLGVYSKFKVSAVNAIGEGTKSDEVTLLAATVPSQVTLLTKKSSAANLIEF